MAGVDEVRREALGRVEVERTVGPHRGDDRRENTSEGGCVSHGPKVSAPPDTPTSRAHEWTLLARSGRPTLTSDSHV
ncbi:hypothetical protein GCM10028802_13300 [Terrabacter terrigena]